LGVGELRGIGFVCGVSNLYPKISNGKNTLVKIMDNWELIMSLIKQLKFSKEEVDMQ
jgi:hypothetical protein